mgnify:CR=1 FL=1
MNCSSEPQSEKFKRLARELECDESEERFDKALERIGKQRPPDEGENKSDEDEPGQ